MVAEKTIPGFPATDGSEKTLEARYELVLMENYPAIRRLAASYTRTSSDRDDLVQDIAMAFWRALPSFRGEASERTFLFRIAHNRAIALLERRRPSWVPVDDEAAGPDTRPGPEEAFAQRQRESQLISAVRTLPIPYRQVVTLALEGMDYAEIAEILGIEISNVGVRLTRARRLLRSLLEKINGR